MLPSLLLDLLGGGQGAREARVPEQTFSRWIETYSSDVYASVVRQVLDVMDQASRGLKEEDLALIRKHFVITSKLEYLFWDMGYRREAWGI